MLPHYLSLYIYFTYIFGLSHCILPKGISSEFASFYAPSHDSKFTCLDKSSVIPWIWVNDEYCDCRDGSDEPGTAACSNTLFYCEDDVHERRPIWSSFVNDMFCDCCDGSDEYSNYANCSNNCGELARARESHILQKRQEFELGHEIYKQYVARKSVELAQETDNQRKQLEQRKEEEEEKLASGHSIDEEGAVASNGDTFVSSDDLLEEESSDTESKKEEVLTSTFASSDDLPEEEFNDDAAIQTKQDEEQLHSHETLGDDEVDEEKEVEYSRQVDGLDSDIPQAPSETNPVPETPPPPPKPIDYGPDNGFLLLTEADVGCLELNDKEYTYSLCPFKNAHQHSRADKTSGTLLGSWNSWVNHPEDSVNWDREAKMELPYNEMLYDGGNACWNGPARSVTVKVACGAENKLIFADEPSRCTYLFHIQTPAACHRHPEEIMDLFHTEL